MRESLRIIATLRVLCRDKARALLRRRLLAHRPKCTRESRPRAIPRSDKKKADECASRHIMRRVASAINATNARDDCEIIRTTKANCKVHTIQHRESPSSSCVLYALFSRRDASVVRFVVVSRVPRGDTRVLGSLRRDGALARRPEVALVE